MLAAEGLVLVRGRRRLVDGIDLALEPGRLTVLVGPNGAGKSTLLAMLSGALRPDAGRVGFAGRPLAAWDQKALARRRAVLRQSSDLGFALDVRQVVELGRSPHQGLVPAAADRAAVEAALAETDCLHLAGRSFLTLSGGERQRVQIARVLAQLTGTDGSLHGRCLLLDEPMTGLDPRHQLELLSFVQGLARRGCTVLAILHDLVAAAVVADRLCVLDAGRLVADAPPAAALTAELAASVFGVGLAWRPGTTAAEPPLPFLTMLRR